MTFSKFHSATLKAADAALKVFPQLIMLLKHLPQIDLVTLDGAATRSKQLPISWTPTPACPTLAVPMKSHFPSPKSKHFQTCRAITQLASKSPLLLCHPACKTPCTVILIDTCCLRNYSPFLRMALK